MVKKKILKGPKKSQKKSMTVNGLRLTRHESSRIFNRHKEIKLALSQALIDGDKEAFVDILSGYVKAHNVLEVCKRTGLSRTVVYEAISESGNPSLDTLCKIMTSFKEAA